MIVLGIETSCDETGVGIVRGDGRTTELLANEVASSVDEHARFGGVVPEVASRAHLSAMVPAVHRAMATAGVTARDVDAVAVTAGPGLSGRAARRPRRGQGLRHGVGRAALRREPPRRARRRRHPAERPAPAVPRAARLRWALQPARRAGHRGPGHAARRDDRRRGGRGVRQGRPAARAAVPGRPAHRPGGPRGRPRGGRVPARAHRPARRAVRLLLLRPQDRGRPARRGARTGGHGRCRWPTSPRASRRPWSTCSPRRPCAPPASGGWTCCCSAAGWPPTRGCGRSPQERCAAAGLTLRVPRPGLCTDNGAMVAALGAHLVGGGREAQPAGPPGRLVAAGHAGAGGLTRARARWARTRAFTPQRLGGAPAPPPARVEVGQPALVVGAGPQRGVRQLLDGLAGQPRERGRERRRRCGGGPPVPHDRPQRLVGGQPRPAAAPPPAAARRARPAPAAAASRGAP